MYKPFPRTALTASIPALFAECTRTLAGRPAVRFQDEEIDYPALAARVNRVAGWLQASAGHEPCAIALLLPQSIDLIVAMLGVLESGNWYVPLEASMKPDALRAALEFAEATVVLTSDDTHEHARAACPGACRAVRVVDAVAPVAAPRNVPPEALAYVYFTSGTTGRPKGVLDSHRNVLHNIMRYTNSLQIGPGDRLTLLQSSTFSGAVSNVFGALLNGATLLMYDAATLGVGAPLARWIESEGPTIYHSVPTIFRSICTEGRVFPTVRMVRLEGDAAAPRDVELFRTHFSPDATLVNGLGATETGICRQFFVRAETKIPLGVLPVGHAVDDMHVHVVDEQGASVAANTIGEIAVRSPYLALGYWRDAQQTDLAFHGDGPQREYRTGDIGRMDDDGCLEHLGRRDDRLKAAGMWVDVPAIEAALEELPSVREAAVAMDESGVGDAVLAAYVVPAGNTPPTFDELRAALVEQFAPYEIPARAWSLSQLPSTSHGKVDRRALAHTAATRIVPVGEYIAPRGAIETTLAAIWREVLELKRVGAQDHFVHLGGTSMQAVHVALEVEKRLGRQLSLTALMEAPTISALAAVIESSAVAASAASLIAVQPRGTEPPLFCVHDLESDAFLFAQLARALGDEQPVYALKYAGAEPLAGVPRTMQELAAQYVQDLQAVRPHGPYRLAGFCYGGVVALAMAEALRVQGEDVQQLVLFNVTPHDLFDLVSHDARKRFRSDWAARARYVFAKPNPIQWAWRKLSRRLRDVAWRVYLPWADRLTPGDEVASAEHARALLMRAFESYAPRPYDGRMILFAAEETLGLYTGDPHSAWAGLTTGELQVHLSPRDGYSMLVEPDVQNVAHRLRASLGSAQE